MDKKAIQQYANIKGIGVGGAGGNAINRMIAESLQGVEFWVVNTDLQALNISLADLNIPSFAILIPNLSALDGEIMEFLIFTFI